MQKSDAELTQQRLVAVAMKKLQAEIRRTAFDTSNPESKPTDGQQEVLIEFGTVGIQYIVAGNQCLAANTLVATPNGPMKICKLSSGDLVYSEHGTPIKVNEVFSNGPKRTYSLQSRGRELARSTGEHRWLSHLYKNDYDTGDLVECSTIELTDQTKIRRVFVQSELGSVNIPTSYVLGALMGDGCCRDTHLGIAISSADYKIPTKISGITGGLLKEPHESNYTWRVKCDRDSIYMYNEWCHGRYAHEKIVDIAELKTWNRESLLNWVAGLFDTDGSLSGNNSARTICWNVSMQAESVLGGLEYALLALWQVEGSKSTDSRAKYKNGPVHSINVRNPHDIKRIMNELDSRIVSDQKRWKSEYDTLGSRSYSDRVSVSLVEFGVEDTYDISVDSPTNLYLLANGLVTHNSGKGQTCARQFTWAMTDSHPYWTKPAEWGNEPLLCIVAGQTGKLIEHSILPKLLSFLEDGSYKVVRIGNITQELLITSGPGAGNKFIFQSLENPNEARKRLQGYVAHFFWGDEMPPTIEVMTELETRIRSKGGFGMYSFTPLVENIHIQRKVDAAVFPYAKKYQFSTLDNPVYKDPKKREALLSEMVGLPKEIQETRLNGAWSASASAVYYFNYQTMSRPLPDSYSRSWRHVECSDPALSSALGMGVFAEDPLTGHWYLVHSEQISGILNPEDLVQTVYDRTSKYNIIRRISDPHEVWYIQTAARPTLRRPKMNYMGVHKKNERKGELIKQAQSKLGVQVFIPPHNTEFIDQLVSCKWSDGENSRIINGSSKHLVDMFTYFCDNIPKHERIVTNMSWEANLLEANERRIKQEATRKRINSGRSGIRNVRRTRRYR